MSMEKTSTGAWRVRWREGSKNRARVIGTKADARLFEADIVRRQRLGELSALDAGKQSRFQTFARETWWPNYVRPNLARLTRENYAGTWDRYIAEQIGGYPIREITAPVVRRWLDDLLARGVSPQSVRRAKAVLQSALTRAVEQGLIQGNPARSVRPPKTRAEAGRAWDRPERDRAPESLPEHPRRDARLSARVHRS